MRIETDSNFREHDPDGLAPNAPGAKLDAGKVRPELIIRGFSRALLAVAAVGTYGANRYSDDGWEEVKNGTKRYTNAMYRHLLAEHTGELCDKDSGLLHAAHAAWNALARLELMLRGSDGESCGKLNDGVRCRMPKGSKCPDCGVGLHDFGGPD